MQNFASNIHFFRWLKQPTSPYFHSNLSTHKPQVQKFGLHILNRKGCVPPWGHSHTFWNEGVTWGWGGLTGAQNGTIHHLAGGGAEGGTKNLHENVAGYQNDFAAYQIYKIEGRIKRPMIMVITTIHHHWQIFKYWRWQAFSTPKNT